MTQTILIAEDEASQRVMLANLLERKGFRVIQSKNGAEALAYLQRDDAEELIDLLLTDLNMPELNGLELIKETRKLHPDLPIIVLTMSTDLEDAVACVRDGAHDFIPKPVEPKRLKLSIDNTLQMSFMRAEIGRLAREKTSEIHFEDLIGHRDGLKQAITTGKKLASSDLPVLITGESGTGKEVFARALHTQSKRVGKPFIAINCGAVPKNLAESVLFGHEKGAFTGAIQQSIGKFREAAGGTLFLDEVGELPLETQAKLLRALQNKEIEPVGLANSVKIDVRIISATHRDVTDNVQEGTFREDLFYRLNVLPIHLPPLRERPQDIEPLIAHFTERLCAKEGVSYRSFDEQAMQYLQNHPWPGNVRELENVISRALLLSTNDVICAEEIEPLLHIARPNIETTQASDTSLNLVAANGERKAMDILEAEIIAKTMQHFADNVPKSAAALGMGQSTLYRKLKR